MSSSSLRSRVYHSRVARVSAVGVAAAALAGGVVTSATGAAPTKYPAAEQYKAISVPDRVVMNPTTDPATSQSVSWRSDATENPGYAEIAKATGGPSFTPTRLTATTSPTVQADLGYPVSFHSATFTGLEPETMYTYRVGDGVNWSEWFQFKTAAASAKPFSFIYYGDAQNGIKQHASRVFRQAFRDRSEAQLVVHAGDLVDSANSDSQWGEWFYAGGFTTGMINQLGIPGNHEYSGGQLARYWDKQFEFPKNGPAAFNTVAPETTYYTDYQGVRFIGLNTNLQGNTAYMEATAAWLEQVLRDNPNEWAVVTYHHPAFSTTGTRNNPNVRKYWLPIFEKYNVDLVLQGHDHSYARGNLAVNRKNAINQQGTVYVVSVSGEKMYELNGGVNWTSNGAEVTKQLEDNQLYQLIDVDGETMRYEARKANGEWHDGFVIEKDFDRDRKRVYDLDEDGKKITSAAAKR
ncbi:purple acid phosphatase family protein [Motilibacter aurantiacus]|uniref:purple acid phosphatase family protein n=1 Tax=Motilibacter aurantiacus TaxID=2714955 RepID=UPI00140C3A2E|nr:metallophosphoesterase family protein [Motilibacter aurantiacus]NHC44313.1 metallophosphoesterase family protein [Motilibacter aurantiacus]